MDNDRFAPPKAEVEGAPLESAAAPPLWNPNAAANWSLLFTPIFGSWLHMLNWRALGETERAESAKTWLVLSTLLLAGLTLGAVVMPFSGLDAVIWPLTFVLLLAWYFASARGQARWVQARYGNVYPRKGWWQPLLGALVLWIATSITMSIIGSVAGALARR